MFDYAFSQYAFQLQMVHSILADIDDVDFAKQWIPEGNHPAWIVGHLATVSDSIVRLFGHTPQLPEAWPALFGRGSTAQADRALYASKNDLLAALSSAHERLAGIVPTVPNEVLAAPHPLKLGALKSLPTIGNLLMHILTTHEALHIGQLSAWRRASGRPPLF